MNALKTSQRAEVLELQRPISKARMKIECEDRVSKTPAESLDLIRAVTLSSSLASRVLKATYLQAFLP
jgi:hypothetical protein